ncbi:hypothetical protein [Bordetella genomosp. 5]|uniref:hypothetical protein n=1 Tax=Bordetella genomosp. 5 TaxID=1395608 RepID=UPI00113FDE3E|nr:hypothetical protein [Bordetella genomosp. 5]
MSVFDLPIPMELTLPGKLQKALERVAADAYRSLHAHRVCKLEGSTPPKDAVAPRAWAES